MWHLSFVALLFLLCNRSAIAGEFELEQLVEKMTSDVLELAAEIESAHSTRCSSQTLEDCSNNNYDACLSEYPNQICPSGEQLNIGACGDGQTCNGLFDFTTTTVRLPKSIAAGADGNPTNPEVIETVCYTRSVEEWFREKYEVDKPFWDSYGVITPPMYFGAVDGTFRRFPAVHSETCGLYDPRQRPWYIAGSSGPKDVILVLDTSGSVARDLETMKEAAATIVKTLTVGDRVAIVRFSEDASITEETGRLVQATEENKIKLLAAIDSFEAIGGTNFYDAFEVAFDAFSRTIEVELHTGCNAAILFFTDGKMTHPDGITEDAVIDLVNARKEELEQRTKHPLTIFTYSIGNEGVHQLPKRIACETGGLWNKIDDIRNLAASMSNYYKLFALGLGEDRNNDFAAWVEPYVYATGGTLGTTVSVPVYDRSVSPHLFLGVAGFDFTLDAMDKALGVPAGSSQTLDAVVRASTAKCPALNLTLCELESLRRQSGGDEAVCTDECSASDFVGIEPEKCASVSSYPENLWKNTDNKGNSFEERVCCRVGSNKPTDECPVDGAAGNDYFLVSKGDKKQSAGAIVGIVFGVLGFLLVATALLFWKLRKRQAADKSTPSSGDAEPSSQSKHTSESEDLPEAVVVHDAVVVDQEVSVRSEETAKIAEDSARRASLNLVHFVHEEEEPPLPAVNGNTERTPSIPPVGQSASNGVPGHAEWPGNAPGAYAIKSSGSDPDEESKRRRSSRRRSSRAEVIEALRNDEQDRYGKNRAAGRASPSPFDKAPAGLKSDLPEISEHRDVDRFCKF